MKKKTRDELFAKSLPLHDSLYIFSIDDCVYGLGAYDCIIQFIVFIKPARSF